ncbi:MAG: hypothetical protein CM15mP46_0710 [Alphaproteobacteria bacterium]|nr:MAG: hypothetical protein CM15mP46_0710 [Alphaproteobacteria bacterium]
MLYFWPASTVCQHPSCRYAVKIMLASAVMGAAIVSLQFGLDRLVFVPAAFGLAVIVGGGGAVYAVTAYVIGAIPPGLLRTRHDRNT